MQIEMLVRGLLIGLAIAAPVGPIGVLCIRRTLAEGRMAGLVSGLGAASADAVYGAIAGLGLVALANLLVSGQLWLRLAGGLYLCYLGVQAFRSHPAEQAAPVSGTGLLGMYVGTFVLTLTNPMTIFAFIAIFAGLGVVAVAGAGWLVSGVFLGSALWWLTLSSLVSLLRARLTTAALRWVNRVAGLVIVGFGLVTVLATLISR